MQIKAANTVWVEKVEVIAASRDFLLAVGWRIEVHTYHCNSVACKAHKVGMCLLLATMVSKC